MSGGKVYASTLMSLMGVGALAGLVLFMSGGGGNPAYQIVGGGLGTVGVVLLLNAVGLGFGKKSFGGFGLLLSAALVGLALYWMVNDSALSGFSRETKTLIMAVFLGTGAIGLLGSIGVAISA